MKLGDTEEQNWILQSQKDPEAFKYLFDRYYHPIFNFVLRRTCDIYATEDITENTFLKALKNIKKYRWRGIAFSAWLYRISINEINQYYRKHRRTFSLSSDHIEAIRKKQACDPELLEVEEWIRKNEQFQQIHTALSSLKPMYQTALTLRYFENFTIKEIASILRISENTVKTHIHRGLKILKERL